MISKKNRDILGTVREPANQSASDLAYLAEIEDLWNASHGSTAVKLEAYTKFVSRQSLTKFIARYEIFKKQLEIHGSVVEVGVHRGASLMTWAHLSSVLEPVNYLRRVIGFDTFSGFPELGPNDAKGTSEHLKTGGYSREENAEVNLRDAIKLFDMNRLMNHIPKVELVPGDVCDTLPEYLEHNPHLVVSLLHLDADLYAPSKVALDTLLPRMPKGAVIVFDELNLDAFPGETLAAIEAVGLHNLRLQRFTFATSISYSVID